MALHSPANGWFEVVVADDPGTIVIRPRGELDLAWSERFAATLRSVDASAGVVVLDLGGLTFLDASGLRVLLEAKRALGARLALLPGPAHVQRLFTLTGTDAALGFSPRADDPSLQAAAANVAYLRELWDAYRAGGAHELAARMPSAPSEPAGDRPTWGPGELGAFWSHTVMAVPAPLAGRCRIQTVGSSVLISPEPPLAHEGPGVIWSLYVFEGRTFIRAVSLAL